MTREQVLELCEQARDLRLEARRCRGFDEGRRRLLQESRALLERAGSFLLEHPGLGAFYWRQHAFLDLAQLQNARCRVALRKSLAAARESGQAEEESLTLRWFVRLGRLLAWPGTGLLEPKASRSNRLSLIAELQENERRTIANFVDQQLSQPLVALYYNLQVCCQLQGDKNSGLYACIELARELLGRSSEVTRVLDHYLENEADLLPALQSLVERFQIATGVRHLLARPSSELSLKGAPGVFIYRIVQEGLTNVDKHAGAQHVWIELTCSKDQLVVSIRDDGVGFDPGRALRARGGLRSISLRAELMGGSLEVLTQAGRGAEIRVMVPRTRG